MLEFENSTETPANAVALERLGGCYGLLAEYALVSELLLAATVVRDAGFTQWDTYAPFPVPGIASAMGLRSTRLPWFVLATGGCGFLATGVWLWFISVRGYPSIISGRVGLTYPASVPVVFIVTVLCCSVATFVAMLYRNGLPRLSHPLLRNAAFQRVTNDRFFLVIEATDPKFCLRKTRAFLETTAAMTVQVVENDTTRATLPRPWVYGFSGLAVMMVVTLSWVILSRVTTSRLPRHHWVTDMDVQRKILANSENQFFADGRSSREPIEGDVAVGELNEDSHRYSGKMGEQYANDIPSAIPMNDASWRRGRERFSVYCVPCHGKTGKGDGPVSMRASSFTDGAWAPPSDLSLDLIRAQPFGQLFESITRGIRNMPAYGGDIANDDRWAIVLYVRTLKRNGNITHFTVPAE